MWAREVLQRLTDERRTMDESWMKQTIVFQTETKDTRGGGREHTEHGGG